MNVGVISRGSPDYLIDIVTDGLIRVLGRCRVALDYNVRGPCQGNYAHLLQSFQGPEPFDIHDAEVLIASIRSIPQVRAWKRKTGKKTVILVDGEDVDQVNPEILYEAKVYFKREYLRHRIYPSKIKPLPFAAIPEAVEQEVKVRQAVFYSWNPTHPFRRDASKALASLGYYPARNQQKEKYNRALMESLIGVAVRGNGWDTYRYWEIPYFGAALLSQRVGIVIPEDFQDGKEAVFFHGVEDLKNKLRKMVSDPEHSIEIGKAGRKACLERHLSTHRAKTVLEAAGVK